MSNVTRCARCGKFSPTGKVKKLQGVSLGPECFRILEKREKIRGGGPNPTLIRNIETGQFLGTSEYSDLCPEGLHCLQCPFLLDEKCPTEKKYGNLF